ncbi:hypothetical protein N2603_38290 [Bradyrhizobium huanghuaihaiense]|uniref:hypothetical protein n=1 Tax=Bradyrhizobium huanghuaihaiense TaxID=990078 RepID=UPI0021AA9142|nr:hypothetical protein [Bradyrhizobium sp. CB3035]UWU75771.1 hypothetical protein N2603_38290 [Bradyrhizobium sp. CB3035]
MHLASSPDLVQVQLHFSTPSSLTLSWFESAGEGRCGSAFGVERLCIVIKKMRRQLKDVALAITDMNAPASIASSSVDCCGFSSQRTLLDP